MPKPLARNVRTRSTCRVCRHRGLRTVLDLGKTPLANAFLPRADVPHEPTYPLRLVRCGECGLVQLAHVVHPDEMFRDYVYFSSYSGSMPAHFRTLANEARAAYAAQGGLVVEIGSNDGTLLKNFLGGPHQVLGVEPARNIAAVANAAGVRTWNDYFTHALAERARQEFGPARLIFSNNVLAHIDDVHDVVAGVAQLLDEEGAWFIEVPHLVPMLQHAEFDTIYHEHLSYFSLGPLERLFEEHGLRLVAAKAIPVHGGSLRLVVRHASARSPRDPNLARVRAGERRLRLSTWNPYAKFRRDAERVRRDLPVLLRRLRAAGGRIVGYGAPAKGNTLLNYCRIRHPLLDYLLDTTPAKQGLFAPGTRLPVRPPTAFHEDPPSHALLLAWNFEKEILAKERPFQAQGGRFVRPVPRPVVIGPGKR